MARNKKIEPYWKYDNRLKGFTLKIFKEKDNTYSAGVQDDYPMYREPKDRKGVLHSYKAGFTTPGAAQAYLSSEESELPNLKCPEGYYFVKRHHRIVQGNATPVSGHCVRNRRRE